MMNPSNDLTPELLASITSYVDIEAPPSEPSTHVIFGTNQELPVKIVTARYHLGLAPFIIATGGVNRHNGIIEGQVFRRLLIEGGVSDSAIRVEDRSTNTWENVQFSLDYLREAISLGLGITAVSKWYHRRVIHSLRTQLPDVEGFHAISWEPIYAGTPVTRDGWQDNAEGRRRVIREWQEIPRRIKEGSLKEALLVNGAWR